MNNNDMHYIQYFAEKYRVRKMQVEPVEYHTFSTYASEYRLPISNPTTVSLDISVAMLAEVAKHEHALDREQDLRERIPAVADAYEKYRMLIELYRETA